MEALGCLNGNEDERAQEATHRYVNKHNTLLYQHQSLLGEEIKFRFYSVAKRKTMLAFGFILKVLYPRLPVGNHQRNEDSFIVLSTPIGKILSLRQKVLSREKRRHNKKFRTQKCVEEEDDKRLILLLLSSSLSLQREHESGKERKKAEE